MVEALEDRTAPTATTLALGSAANPSTYTQDVTFTAVVSPSGDVGAIAVTDGDPSASGLPSGVVTYYDGDTALGTATLSVVNGQDQVALDTSALAIGSHTITASYGGDATFDGSSDTLTQVVQPVATSLALTSSLNPTTVGQDVTFTAAVSFDNSAAGGAPTGTVTFTDNGIVLGTASLALVNGVDQATLDTSGLSLGLHGVTASYEGDGTFAGSSGSLLQSVQVPTMAAVALSSSANPSLYGWDVTFTAAVTSLDIPSSTVGAFGDTYSAPSSTPTGTMDFFLDGDTFLGTATLDGQGQATLDTAGLSPGQHTIAVNYSGDDTFVNSIYGTSLTQEVLSLDWVGPTFTWTQSQLPPVVTNPGDQANAEGDTVSLPIAATDPNGGALGYQAVNLPAGLTIDPGTGLISGTVSYQAAEDVDGSYPVEVLVSNSQGATLAAFTWAISDTPRPPVLAPINDQSNVAGDGVSLQVSATQPDGDPLWYDVSGLPSGLTIDADTGLISGTIGPSAVADTPYVVTVTASDFTQVTAQSVSRTFTWAVGYGTPAPSLESPGDQANAAGDVVDLWVGGSDGGGYALTYTADGLPDGLSIDPSTGEITGTIANSAASPAPYTVTLTAGDGYASASVTLSWSVSGVAVSYPGSQENAEGDTVSLQISASDANESALSYSATGLPDGLMIDGSTGLISGTVAAGASTTGWFDVVATATDGTYSTDTEFGWTITSVDDSGSGDDGGSGGTDSGSQLGSVQAVAFSGTEVMDTGPVAVATFTDTDPNADTTYFTAMISWGDGTSDKGTINGSGGAFTVTGSHVYTQAGTYTTQVSVTDGLATVEGSASATIADVPPALSGGEVEGAVAGTPVSATWASFTDWNPDAAGSYTATIDWGDGSAPVAGTVTGSDGDFVVSGSHTYGQAGAYTVTVTIVDAYGASASATSTAEVGDVYAGLKATLTVASFTSSDPSATADQYTATVDWGDGSGTDSNVTVTATGSGTFTVQGSHTYAVDSLDQPGSAYQVTVTISSAVLDVAVTTATSDVRVERPPVQGVGEDVSAQVGVAFSDVEVATFTEPDLSDGTGEFSATVSWGDGTTSAGAVTKSGGAYHVLGNHTYATPGEFPIEVDVSQAWSWLDGVLRLEGKAQVEVPGDGQFLLTNAKGPATEENFRLRFWETVPGSDGLTKNALEGWHVNHDLPQAFEARFAAAGINIHESQYLCAMTDYWHRQFTVAFNAWAEAMMRKNGWTKAQFLEKVSLEDVEAASATILGSKGFQGKVIVSGMTRAKMDKVLKASQIAANSFGEAELAAAQASMVAQKDARDALEKKFNLGKYLTAIAVFAVIADGVAIAKNIAYPSDEVLQAWNDLGVTARPLSGNP